jgi:hypothetical protein
MASLARLPGFWQPFWQEMADISGLSMLFCAQRKGRPFDPENQNSKKIEPI